MTLQLFLRRAVGLLFLLTGLFKLLLVAPFADALASRGVPLPEVAAPGVVLLEIVGGVALARNWNVRPFAALLACDMIAAIMLVGAPGARGQTTPVGTAQIGGEPWRLPLELVLLAATLFLALRPSNHHDTP